MRVVIGLVICDALTEGFFPFVELLHLTTGYSQVQVCLGERLHRTGVGRTERAKLAIENLPESDSEAVQLQGILSPASSAQQLPQGSVPQANVPHFVLVGVFPGQDMEPMFVGIDRLRMRFYFGG